MLLTVCGSHEIHCQQAPSPGHCHSFSPSHQLTIIHKPPLFTWHTTKPTIQQLQAHTHPQTIYFDGNFPCKTELAGCPLEICLRNFPNTCILLGHVASCTFHQLGRHQTSQNCTLVNRMLAQ